MTEAEQYFINRALIWLAGPLAQARAHRKSANGWVLTVSSERSRAIHEAGHAVCAICVGQYAHKLSIVPDPARPMGPYGYSGGYCITSPRSDPSDSLELLPAVRDRSQVARAAWLLTRFDAPSPRWKAVLATARALRQVAAQIVEKNWALILAIASELERQKELDREGILAILDRLRATVADAPLL